MSKKTIVLDNITKCFGKVMAVKNFYLEVGEGEFVTLLGPSGCGKTTVLRIIAGFEKPDKSDVYIFGKKVTGVPPEKRDVGMVFQSYALFPNMTVGQNIAFPMRIAKKPKDKTKEKVKELLKLVKLEDFEDRKIDQLSGGQKQRIALVRALAKEPKVLLLDEPLSALDAKVRKKLREEIRKLQQDLHITTLYVTHDQEEALSISDRIIVMSAGVIQQIGTPGEIYKRPANIFVADFIGTTNMLKGEVSINKGVRFHWHNELFYLKSELDVEKGPAILSIRPDIIEISKSQDDIPCDMNYVRGKVVLVVFLGLFVRLSLRTSYGDEIVVDLSSDGAKRFKPGDNVFIYFPADAGILLKGGV